MSLRRTLDVMGAMVERASSVPLSASCMVNRAEMLSLVERARSELPVELDEAAALLVAHQDVIARAEQEAEQVLQRARTGADELIEDSALVATARARSEQILDAARTEAARLLREADEYCDRRLAAFEDDLERASAQVRRGRQRLRERSDLDSVDTLQAHGTDLSDPSDQPDQADQGESAESDYDEYSQEYVVEETVEYVEEQVAFDQDWVPDEEPEQERAPVTVGAQRERRILDVAQMERAAAERAGLGQRVNLQ
jgi:cell division septum initiation protein DivIVA